LMAAGRASDRNCCRSAVSLTSMGASEFLNEGANDVN